MNTFPSFSDKKNASEFIQIDTLDYTLLNALVHQGINEVRKTKGAAPLSPNELLEKAALDHNNYQVEKNSMTHKQKGKDKRTVKDRVLFFGGGFKMMGENVQYSGFPVKTWSGSSRKEIVCPTYLAAAQAIVKNWVDSPGHYKNLIHPDFRFVGTATGWSAKKNAVFATQVFGA